MSLPRAALGDFFFFFALPWTFQATFRPAQPCWRGCRHQVTAGHDITKSSHHHPTEHRLLHAIVPKHRRQPDFGIICDGLALVTLTVRRTVSLGVTGVASSVANVSHKKQVLKNQAVCKLNFRIFTYHTISDIIWQLSTPDWHRLEQTLSDRSTFSSASAPSTTSTPSLCGIVFAGI